jgi:HK97 family phage major capsid protein
MADENKSPELIAIEKIEKQHESMVEALGEKASKTEMEAIGKDITDVKKFAAEMTEKELDKKIEEINDGLAKQVELVEEIKESVSVMKESGQGNKFEPTLTEEALKEYIDKVRASKNTNQSMVIKAPEVFGYDQTFGGTGSGVDQSLFTGRTVDPEFYQRRRKANFILDNMNMRPIGTPVLHFMSKEEVGDANPTAGDPGGAGWILCGDPKPQRSFRVTADKVEAKKLAIYTRAQDALLEDIPSFRNWIQTDMRDEMMEAFNDGLLNNDVGINPLAPEGLKTNATLYAPTPGYATDIVVSNKVDQIFAAIARMRFLKEQANIIGVSSDVYYRLQHLKGNDGHYIGKDERVFVNNVGQLFIGGVMVVAADEEDIPSTHLLVLGADNGFNIRTYKDIVLEQGLNGQDFREDHTSFRAYQRVLSYIPPHRANSVMYDTFDNIATAIDV